MWHDEQKGRSSGGVTYRGAPRRGSQAPGRLRQVRKIQNKAATRRIERCKTYSAKCAALPQLTSQETPCGSSCDATGSCRIGGKPGLSTHAGRRTQPTETTASRMSCEFEKGDWPPLDEYPFWSAFRGGRSLGRAGNLPDSLAPALAGLSSSGPDFRAHPGTRKI